MMIFRSAIEAVAVIHPWVIGKDCAPAQQDYPSRHILITVPLVDDILR